MKKVEFMKLNLQQENILSKEERKGVLGGYGSCYARCNGYYQPVPSCGPSDLANHSCDASSCSC
ncbi:hypothetical protein [uncultured Parabacteroides sp.]|uniref:hypothetical protein n=1 Tax=uncultured Parabacteroides sp. TaxID=512312 RepID=UPI002803D805|nr:hypothetical protein [uncultured Parabacteroides sp.]